MVPLSGLSIPQPLERLRESACSIVLGAFGCCEPERADLEQPKEKRTRAAVLR